MSLRLHPEHGVNPSLSQCFWCGGDKNEILLLGANRGKKAPHRVCFNYEPCDKCKEQFSQGIRIFEAKTSPCFDGQLEIDSGMYPTGRMVVVREEFITRMFQPKELVDSILEKRVSAMEPEAFEAFFGEHCSTNECPKD